MAANSLFATAVQALCVVAWKGVQPGQHGWSDANVIARSLHSHPVLVRRLLKSLEKAGLVELKPGRHGGVRLRRKPNSITLEDVRRATEPGAPVFALRERGNPRCPVNQAMVRSLPPVLADADEAVSRSLRGTRLSELVAEVA